MTAQSQDTVQNDIQSAKELNFRRQEQALKESYEVRLSQERNARLEAERQLQDRNSQPDDDDDDEPYVDKKKLDKKLQKFGEQTKQQTKSDIQTAVHAALKEERKSNWLKQHGDFYEVLKHAEKLANKDPELAESILDMPESFERQKLVYKNIKAMRLHEPEVKEQSVQEKIDSNRRGPFYQPASTGTAPYASSGDFSPTGQKSAYDHMQELKSRLRI